MKNLYPVLCFILVGMLYVGCNEDFPTQSAGDTEQVTVFESPGGVMLADKKGGGGGGGGGGATYDVQLNIVGLGSGEAIGTPGSTRRGVSIGEGAMRFTPIGDFGCAALDNLTELNGLFALVLVQNKHPEFPNEFTYASVNFFLFTGEDGKSYSIALNSNPRDFYLSNWDGLTDGTGFVVQEGIGFMLEGPKNSDCNGDLFTNPWTITVTLE